VDGDTGVDASVDGVDPPQAPALPAVPTPPTLTPCRPGWVEAEGVDGLTICEPYDGPSPTSCPVGEAPFVGEGCARVGDPCPAGDFHDDLPATGVVYVRPGAAGGNGARDRPFGRIGQGVMAAGMGDTVALSKGTFAEEVYLDDFEDVRIVGACPEETVWEPSSPSLGFGTFEVSRGRAELSNLTIRGPRQAVRFEGPLASGDLESVIIDGAAVVGLAAYAGAVVTARSIHIDGTTPHPDGVGGRAVSSEGGDLTITRAVLENNHSEAVASVGAGSVIRLSETLARGTSESDGFAGGLTVGVGGRIEADGVVVEGNELVGILATMDATLVLRDSVVRDNGTAGAEVIFGSEASFERVRFERHGTSAISTQEDSAVTADDVLVTGTGERGLVVGVGSSATARRVHVVESTGTSFLALSGEDTRPATITLEDIYARDGGTTLQIQEGASGTVTRLRSERSLRSAVVIRGDGVSFEGRDLDLSEMRRFSMPEDLLGDRARGLEVRVGADALVERLRVTDAFQLGVFVEEATATLRDVTVVGTTARDDIAPAFGRGIEGQRASLIIERAHLERNQGAGLSIGGGTVTITDLTVLDTRGSGELRATGKGVAVNQGAQLEMDRVALISNREVSLAAFEMGTRVVGRNIVVLDTRVRDCVVDDCPDLGAGIGVGAYLSSHITLSRFAIGGAALVGLQLAGGTAELTDGRIMDNPIGINLQTEGFDFAELTRGVRLENNDRNVDTTVIPIPDAVDPLAAE